MVAQAHMRRSATVGSGRGIRAGALSRADGLSLAGNGKAKRGTFGAPRALDT